MSVEGVNNSNNNAGLYAAGAGLLGAGAGAAAGYYTRPFLKDGVPTDEFVKKINENLKEMMSPDERKIAVEFDNKFISYRESINNAKTVEELKDVMIKNAYGKLTDESLQQLKESIPLQEQIIDSLGLDKKQGAKIMGNIEKANSVEDLMASMRTSLDELYAGKSLEEIKSTELDALKNLEQSSRKAVFEHFWDNSKKAFVNCEEGLGKAIKQAARSIQGKYAAIYGSIGAAVLGLGTLLCCGGKKEQPQNIDA